MKPRHPSRLISVSFCVGILTSSDIQQLSYEKSDEEVYGDDRQLSNVGECFRLRPSIVEGA